MWFTLLPFWGLGEEEEQFAESHSSDHSRGVQFSISCSTTTITLGKLGKNLNT